MSTLSDMSHLSVSELTEQLGYEPTGYELDEVYGPFTHGADLSEVRTDKKGQQYEYYGYVTRHWRAGSNPNQNLRAVVVYYNEKCVHMMEVIQIIRRRENGSYYFPVFSKHTFRPRAIAEWFVPLVTGRDTMLVTKAVPPDLLDSLSWLEDLRGDDDITFDLNWEM